MKLSKRACAGCGRVVAVRSVLQNNGGGKHRRKHKCPHGFWCVFGEWYGQQGWNQQETCAGRGCHAPHATWIEPAHRNDTERKMS